MPVENKDIVRRLYEEVWNNRKREVLRELISPRYILVAPQFSGLAKGPEAYWREVSRLAAAFADVHVTIEETVAEQDKVVVCWTRGS